jgi:hypothetical protein
LPLATYHIASLFKAEPQQHKMINSLSLHIHKQ